MKVWDVVGRWLGAGAVTAPVREDTDGTSEDGYIVIWSVCLTYW